MEDRPAERTAESPFKGKTGLQRLLNATRYSLHGLASGTRTHSGRKCCSRRS
jgi:hypothetical protein